MSHAASSRSTSSTRNSSLVGLLKLVGRLTPRQLSDEIALAKIELKRKGIQAGIASAFLVVALVFIVFLAVALITAAILGLATIMPGWLAALLVAAAFLVIAAVAALIGIRRFKKVMPLLPEDAILGIQYDIGVLKEGSEFDPQAVQRKKEQAKREKEASKRAAERIKAKQPPQPGPGELRTRAASRRDNIAAVRDALGHKLDISGHLRALGAKAQDSAARLANRSPEDTLTTVKERWQPLTLLAVSTAVLIVLVRKLAKR